MAKMKSILCGTIITAIAIIAGCSKDPAEQEKELRMQLAAANRLIESYKTNKYDGVEQLEEWRKDLEAQLQDLQK